MPGEIVMIETDSLQATIRLFKAIPISVRKSRNTKDYIPSWRETIKSGYILSSEVIDNYDVVDVKLIESHVDKILGLSAEKMNNTFHKSWKKVKTASLEQLVIEQMIHYLTTYGKEAGIFNCDSDFVYIPSEALEIPKLDLDKIPLVLIKGLTKTEIKERLMALLSSGIALSKNTITDVLDVMNYTGISEKELPLVKNREVSCALYKSLRLTPENPVEFLRLLVYVTTDQTLLIKNKDLIKKIKTADEQKFNKVLSLFSLYESDHGLEKLAEVFYRFKPLFLAFKHDKYLNNLINRTRKLAVKNHKPMPEDYLNSITGFIKNEKRIDKAKFDFALSKTNVFRKIRLAYALKFRTTDSDSILYRIRNGKSYATDFNFEQKKLAETLLNVTLQSIAKDMAPKVKGKKICIPSSVHYTLPATEKQFSGNFPSGSYVSVPTDMLFGIHWENQGEYRVDLDLSLIALGTKYGWDSSYRSLDGKILFSGDMTNASLPNGASEFFYLAKNINGSYLLMVNFFNHHEYRLDCKSPEVPISIIVAKEQVKSFGKDYIVNPNNILAICNSKITEKQKMLGLMVSDDEGNRFYFIETNMGSAITSSNSKLTEISRKFMLNYYNNSIELEDLLIMAGAKIVRNDEKADIDLSPAVISKDSFLSIL
jgi:hypothetical protein